jgi:hypothetical protein
MLLDKNWLYALHRLLIEQLQFKQWGFCACNSIQSQVGYSECRRWVLQWSSLVFLDIMGLNLAGL